jgi:serine/threonine-protein kinase SRPK3
MRPKTRNMQASSRRRTKKGAANRKVVVRKSRRKDRVMKVKKELTKRVKRTKTMKEDRKGRSLPSSSSADFTDVNFSDSTGNMDVLESPRDARRERSDTASGPALISESHSSDMMGDSENNSHDDPSMNKEVLAVRVGSTFKEGRYKVHRKLGSGSFSTVWLAWDSDQEAFVALKVQNGSRDCAQAAQEEIKILKEVAAGDKAGSKSVVRLLDHFDHRGPNGRRHTCMVLEYLGDNLLVLLKKNKYKGLPLPLVKKLSRQILVGLDYLHSKLKIIHTDVKPENILLVSPLDPDKDPRKQPATDAATHNPVTKRARRENQIPGNNNNNNINPVTKKQGSLSEKNPECFDNKENLMKTKDTNTTATRKLTAAHEPGLPLKIHQPAETVGTYDSTISPDSTSRAKQELSSSSKELPPIDSINPNPNSSRNKTMTTMTAHGCQCQGAGVTFVGGSDDSPPQKSPKSKTAVVDHRVAKTDQATSSMRVVHDKTLLCAASSSGSFLLNNIDTRCKIADLGTAFWTHKQLTRDIQTRPYRCPEVLLGAKKLSTSADIWSVACLVFELATGNALFNPRSGGHEYSRDEDHLREIMEVLGPLPPCNVFDRASNYKDYLTRNGELRRIKPQGHCPLHQHLIRSYNFSDKDAHELSDFLLPLLDLNPDKRPSANQCLQHPWLMIE